MMAMYRSGTSKMGAYYAAGQKMNNTIVEYINGMEVVKVFNRDGESYHRFESDIRSYRDFTWTGTGSAGRGWPCIPPYFAMRRPVYPAGRRVAGPGGLFFPAGSGPGTVHVLFGIGAPLVRAMSFMSTMPPDQFQDQRPGGDAVNPPCRAKRRPLQRHGPSHQPAGRPFRL